VRTRHHAPETNGVVERFNGSLKYKHLYRVEIADVLGLHDQVEAYRELYNWVRPHETLGLVHRWSAFLFGPLSAGCLRRDGKGADRDDEATWSRPGAGARDRRADG